MQVSFNRVFFLLQIPTNSVITQNSIARWNKRDGHAWVIYLVCCLYRIDIIGSQLTALHMKILRNQTWILLTPCAFLVIQFGATACFLNISSQLVSTHCFPSAPCSSLQFTFICLSDSMPYLKLYKKKTQEWTMWLSREDKRSFSLLSTNILW